jgi:epsilon-lactone hydrolase
LVQTLPALRGALNVKVEPTTFDGVKAFIVAPETIPPDNRNRLLIHVHGCYASFACESGTAEAISYGQKIESIERTRISTSPA